MEAPTSPLDGPILKLPWKLDMLVRDGFILPKGVEDEIPLIKRDLGEIISILSNLDDHLAMKVSCWRKEARELSYDMEDFIDQYQHAAAAVSLLAGSVPLPRRKTIQKRRSKTSTLFRLRERLNQRLWMANKIREFSVRTQEALQRHSMYINPGTIAVSGSTSTRCTDDACSSSSNSIPCGEENAYVGISAPMEKLQELLMEGHQKLKVVSIVGFGGIGKTTLANEIYRKIGQQFESCAFVRTSQKPDMRRIFISMLSQIRPHQPPDNWTVHSLISIIRTHLQDKRYLIIVEDICATSTWDIVKCALPDNDCCSRILTTTETEDLALLSCDHDPKYVYKMQPLGEDDSRKLFFSSLFGTQHECPPDLRETSYNVISKCGGLPLAVVTVAGVLSSKPGIQDQWDYVNKSIDYSLSANPTSEGMKQILDLSYNSLPQNLKACILYTGLYEEDTIIWKDDLVNQWIAEGFIQPSEGRDMKEMASSLFDRLISRKLILPVDRNKNEDAVPPINMRLSHLRTLVFFGVFKCYPSTVQFHLLQVLILHFWGDKDSIGFDLTTISELFRLRYLKVTSNVILELGNKIRGLQSLETLTIEARVSAVPSDIVHLPGLLHLSLPADTKLPKGIGHMTSLITLGYFDLSRNSIENVMSLSMLTNLRNLQLTCSTVLPENLDNIMQLLLTSILGRLSNLKSLTLVPRASTNAKSVDETGDTSLTISVGLSSLSSAPDLLQSFEVSRRICIFYWLPKWIGQLHKLCILKIGLRKIDRDDVDVVRGLPALAVLSLYVQTKPAERIVIEKTGFPVTRYFKFKCHDPWLKFEEGAMPNLRKLKLVFNAGNADEQITIPVGIRYLSNLEEVSAKICGAGPSESHRRATELSFRSAITVHARCQRVNIQCVGQLISGKDDQTCITPVEDYWTLKQYMNKDVEDSNEHVEIIQEHSGQVVDTNADNRSTLSELHILLLLRSKLDNKHDDIMRSIPIVDVFSYDPWNLERSGTMHGGLLLFFRQPFAWVNTGRSPSGYWKVTGSAGYIYSAERLAIGMKRTMEFYSGHQLTSATKTKWKIQEFTAFQQATPEICALIMPRSEMSLCQLYTELAGNNPAGGTHCSSAGVPPHQSMSVKQNEIPADERSEKIDIVRTRKKDDKRKRLAVKTVESLVTSRPYADGYTWTTYGRKFIGSARYPREYYKCNQRRGCKATKQVQRRNSDPILYDVFYHEEHSCKHQAAHSNDDNGQRSETIARAEGEAELPLLVPPRVNVNSVEAGTGSGLSTDCSKPSVSSHSQPRRRSVTSQVVMSNPNDDGYSWRLYGQKDIQSAKHPRSYYRCAHGVTKGCSATKTVQRVDADSLLFDVIYFGQHTCDQIAHSTEKNSSPSGSITGSTSTLGSDQVHFQEDKESNQLDFGELFSLADDTDFGSYFPF